MGYLFALGSDVILGGCTGDYFPVWGRFRLSGPICSSDPRYYLISGGGGPPITLKTASLPCIVSPPCDRTAWPGWVLLQHQSPSAHEVGFQQP